MIEEVGDATSAEIASGKPVFDIGLVMAGAISAGAYTAGVADFLIEALDEWYKSHEGNPPHDVRLRVISGASAGGMVGSILFASFGGDFRPVKEKPPQGVMCDNELYRAWVQEIDIAHLLKSEDLKKRKQLRSALDSTKLREIAEHAIKVKPSPEPLWKRRPYLSNPIQLILTIANLRGIPYSLELHGGSERMIAHADYMRFAIGNPPHEPAFMLDPTDYSKDEWKFLAKSALATGAFPFGLSPRRLSRPWDHYFKRKWPVTIFDEGETTTVFRELAPERDENEEIYEFVSVDGGLLNNEPFDLAHSALTPQGRNERDGLKSARAIILVAPFPTGGTREKYEAPNDLVSFSGAILGSLMAQVRFKPEELILALDDNVYSRFIISPRRPERFPTGDIACGALGGFSGFLHEDFRHHDFMLGRRNCQWFLKRSFVLPCEDKADRMSNGNPLFRLWSDELRKSDLRVRPKNDTRWHLPIIPCVGSAKEEVKLLNWPSYPPEKLGKLMSQIDGRLTNVGHTLIDMHAGKGMLRLFLKFGLWAKKNTLLDAIRQRIETDLRQHKLLDEVPPRPEFPFTPVLLLVATAIAAAVVLYAFGLIG